MLKESLILAHNSIGKNGDCQTIIRLLHQIIRRIGRELQKNMVWVKSTAGGAKNDG